MASIYLGFKEGTYNSKVSGDVDSTIDVTKQIYDKCSTFEVRRYKISYPGSEHDFHTFIPGNYILYIHTGSFNRFGSLHGELIYSYFPSQDNIIDQVDSYYLSDSDFPFALVFTTGGAKKIYYTFDELKRESTSTTLNGTSIEEGNLCNWLHRDSNKLGTCKNFQFKVGLGSDQNVVSIEQNISAGNNYKRVIFTPNPGVHAGSESVLHSGNLLSLTTKNDLENEIDESYFCEVKGPKFNAVIVFYVFSQDTGYLALLVEFVNECETTHIRRINNKPPIWLKREVHYIDDSELAGQLRQIKEDCETAITYKLDKNENDEGYVTGSISVAKVSQTFDSGYNIYKHTLQDSGPMPILLYKDKQIQFVKNNNIPHDNDTLKPSDGDIFTEINTYALSDYDTEHLLIRVTIKSINYYLYRYSSNGVRWRQLGLQDLLRFGAISYNDMDKLRQYGGGLANQIEQFLQTRNNMKILLEEISFSIKSIIVSLQNKKHTYRKLEIEGIIGKNGFEKDIPPVDIDTNTITVTDGTDATNSGCLDSNGYHVHKHDLRSAGESAREKSPRRNLYLRFYLETKLIRLYDSSDGKHRPLEYQDDMNDLYVYYYGDKDPRPLLLCYGDKAYKPNSLDDYDKKWVKEDKIKNCLCLNEDDDKKLLDVLSDVVGILNAVQLKRPEFGKLKSFPKEENKYNIQNFNGDIRIKVTCEDKKCHRVYTHNHDGIGGLTHGFRLGYVKYESKSLDADALKYTSSKPLLTVSVYYNVYDENLEYQLLVVLDFKGGTDTDKQYYKLSKSDKPYKWEKVKSYKEGGSGDDPSFLEKLKELKSEESEKNQEKLQEAIERKAYNIRSDLGIKFDKEKGKPLFDPKDCKEDKINWVAVGAGSGGGVVAVGTVVTAGVLVSKNLATAAVATAAATTAAL